MTEDEALILAQDIVKAVKVSRQMREARIENLGLRVIK
jgi:hypothetical protein